MDPHTAAQLRTIREVRDALAAGGGIPWWLFGGWGTDARLGRVTRHHRDIEFWVHREDSGRTRKALTGHGFEAPPAERLEQAREFVKDGVECSSAFFDQRGDGTIRVQGRWPDWRLPPNSFDCRPGRIGDLVVPAMSVEGLLAMKEQFPALRNGHPFRDKDLADIAALRALQSQDRSSK